MCQRNISILKRFANELHGNPNKSSTSTSLHATRYPQLKSELISTGHIAFRLARRTDIPQIQDCNLSTLPENYNANFYLNHMRQWPELTLVAEHIPEGLELENEKSGITPLGDFLRSKDSSSSKPRKVVVGYLLGKVEERRVRQYPRSRVAPMYNPQFDEEETLLSYMNGNLNGSRINSNEQYEKIGHITSLAVLSNARRLGIGTSLVHQLHHHLQSVYSARSVGLHVRISNKAAVRLYVEEGYDVADIIPRYYGDGEDAYFMSKDLISVDEIKRREKGMSPLQQLTKPDRRYRRGEKEREEWMNRAALQGSHFDGRNNMQDNLSEEERAWVGANGPMSTSAASRSISGHVRRSFRTFFNGSEQNGHRINGNGPLENLRLPRYRAVIRGKEETKKTATSLSDLASQYDTNDDILGEGEDDLILFDRVACNPIH